MNESTNQISSIVCYLAKLSRGNSFIWTKYVDTTSLHDHIQSIFTCPIALINILLILFTRIEVHKVPSYIHHQALIAEELPRSWTTNQINNY